MTLFTRDVTADGTIWCDHVYRQHRLHSKQVKAGSGWPEDHLLSGGNGWSVTSHKPAGGHHLKLTVQNMALGVPNPDLESHSFSSSWRSVSDWFSLCERLGVGFKGCRRRRHETSKAESVSEGTCCMSLTVAYTVMHMSAQTHSHSHMLAAVETSAFFVPSSSCELV